MHRGICCTYHYHQLKYSSAKRSSKKKTKATQKSLPFTQRVIGQILTPYTLGRDRQRKTQTGQETERREGGDRQRKRQRQAKRQRREGGDRQRKRQ